MMKQEKKASLNSDSEEEYNINKLNDATKILENIIMEIDDTNFRPLELFYNYFDDSLIIKICENPNKYWKLNNEQHKEITKEERLDSIFINIYFSVIYLPEKEMFSNCNIVKAPFPLIMNLSKFLSIN